MSHSSLEHINITVSDPEATAKLLCELFDWHERWRGEAIYGGRSIHIGSETDYIAVYTRGASGSPGGRSYDTTGGLNHVGVVVQDLEAVEARVKQAGLLPHSHADYEPGRRFYFNDRDGIEYEVVSYTSAE